MAKKSKAWQEAAKTVDRNRNYDISEAIQVVKAFPAKKFDETVEAVLVLNVDPRKADQAIRGVVNLPNGTGKTAKVVVIAQADAAEKAKAAGADEVGSDELIDKIFKGYTDFDAVVATPDLMGKVGKLGKVLGPRGLMPNPKLGTVTMDTAKAVEDIKGGKIEFRVDKNGNLAFIIGKKSFDAAKLVENYRAVFDEVMRQKPSTIKGRYIKKGGLSTTMGVGVPLSIDL
ncbi:MAG: 50S ribosomal protein L1 [Candidatus Ancillula sp.]|jgi:large subunit ribosomal protein L1|nr:50S ribosomal protein L1 [Candidatus Ancillula sp.]